jgi:hypothetical protein
MIIRGSLNLNSCSNLTSLEIIEEITGSLYLRGCDNLKSLGNLNIIGGHIDLVNSGITREYILKNYVNLINRCIFY